MRRITVVPVVLALIAATPSVAVSPDEWREDIRELVELVETKHPSPYTRVKKRDFHRRAHKLIANVASMNDAQISVESMALVASIRDGHTTLHPVDPAGFNRWLPLAFYWFSDGVFVVSAHRDYAKLIGAEVRGIGDTDIGDALSRVTPLIGSDNLLGNRWNTFYLASVDALTALGLVENVDTVKLHIVDKEGKQRAVNIKAVETDFVLNETRFWGEMYAPVQRDVLSDFIIPFESMSLAEYTRSTAEEKSGLPLHVRHRKAYWFNYLSRERALYIQINHMTPGGRGDYESFQTFYNDAFAYIEENPVEKVILDIRYNSGGDGSIVIPFVHKFICSDKANRPGQLFTITGRKTYSAATMLLDQMLKHTNTIVVGEPPGSALNSFGDPRDFKLPNSGLLLGLSSEYWKLVHTSLSPRLTPIDIPAVFSSEDYFLGRDPAVDQILEIDGAYRRLDEVLATDGGTATRERYDRERQIHGRRDWWHPFDESEFRKVARRLGHEGNFEDSNIGFEILVDAYPDSWRAWRDFGKLYLDYDRSDKALWCLQRAAQINPGDPEVNQLIDQLRRDR
jgi:tetratricopeptide (TPR) repeat protein